jgi:hypothetical protein
MAITQIGAQSPKTNLPPRGLIAISCSRQNQQGLYTDVAGPHSERLGAAVGDKSPFHSLTRQTISMSVIAWRKYVRIRGFHRSARLWLLLLSIFLSLVGHIAPLVRQQSGRP